MFSLDRRNTTALGRWWWTIDRPMVISIMVLIFIGVFLIAAASPPVAHRIGLPDFYFVTRHQIFLGLSVIVMVAVSMLSPAYIKRIALAGLILSFLVMLLLPLIGYENKGAIRWLHIGGMSIQPSEFMKPCFAVVLGWVFSQHFTSRDLPAYRIAAGIYALAVLLLIMQPDFGMSVTVTAVFGVQFFLAGMPFMWVALLLGGFMIGAFAAYQFLPHVTQRIDRFLDPTTGDNYQVQQSLEAFRQGGLIGKGPGEGVVKQSIPDAHTDFIFAVVGEEFGMIVCMAIMALFAFIVLRGLMRLREETDHFTIIAVAGILTQFGMQAFINMGVAVNLLPAKGMTLPFLSYGGSSLMAVALGMGMMLGLTRRKFGQMVVDLRTGRQG